MTTTTSQEESTPGSARDSSVGHLPRNPRTAHAQHPAPRIVIYHQTHFAQNGTQHISLLPLLSEKPMAVTHVILAAVHLNERPGDVTLNDDPFKAPKNDVVWQEARTLRKSGIKVMAMLGGAAKGSYQRLDSQSRQEFRQYYEPLRDLVRWAELDGLDLDVEEHMSLGGIIRLILQLRQDFGQQFIITLAPVATALQERSHAPTASSGGNAMMSPQRVAEILAAATKRTNLSGFSYAELEKAVGHEIDWYNAQFYCGWGSAENPRGYDRIVGDLIKGEGAGWPAERIVMGLITNPEAGQGWVEDEVLYETLLVLTARHPGFGGVMGWEYFGSITAAEPYGLPWSWARLMTRILRPDVAEEQG